jgi:hypothetical protein
MLFPYVRECIIITLTKNHTHWEEIMGNDNCKRDVINKVLWPVMQTIKTKNPITALATVIII